MIDTVKLKFHKKLSQQQLSKFTRETRCEPEKSCFNFYYLNVELTSANGSGSATLKCEYYPKDYTGNPLLCLESSFPKILYGSNFFVVTDISQAIPKLNLLINDLTFLPPLDVGEGYLKRIDFFFDHFVDDYLPSYHRVLSNISYPHREFARYKWNGVEYASKNDRTIFYDKYEESGYIATKGYLRQETRLRGAKVFKTRLHQGRLQLKDITLGMASAVLNQDLERLKIDNCFIPRHDEVLDILNNHYSKRKATSLFVFCQMLTNYTEKELREMKYISDDTFYQYKKELKAAGITPVISSQNVTLPPLSIDWNK